MKKLISCVGYSDPIRNNHDGALLHIARVERPDQIIILHSEDSLERQNDLEIAILSIDTNYQPEIIVHPYPIKNVAFYDGVYSQVSSMIKKYIENEDQVILNLSSGTPQMNSAMFSINQIYDYHFQAVQVLTPVYSTNAGIAHNHEDNIDELVRTNKDQTDDFENRTRESRAKKFTQTLTARNMITLIDHYDYNGVYDLVKEIKGFPGRKQLLHYLEQEILPPLHRNKLPREIKKLNYSENLKKALFNFLVIQMKFKRGEMSDSLVKIQSLADYLAMEYLTHRYEDIFIIQEDIVYLNVEEYPEINTHLSVIAKEKNSFFEADKSYLGLPHYQDILQFLEKDCEIQKYINHILQVRHMRNSVAHRLEEIPHYNQRQITSAYKAVEEMLKETYTFDSNLLNFYKEVNKELKKIFLVNL